MASSETLRTRCPLHRLRDARDLMALAPRSRAPHRRARDRPASGSGRLSGCLVRYRRAKSTSASPLGHRRTHVSDVLHPARRSRETPSLRSPALLSMLVDRFVPAGKSSEVGREHRGPLPDVRAQSMRVVAHEKQWRCWNSAAVGPALTRRRSGAGRHPGPAPRVSERVLPCRFNGHATATISGPCQYVILRRSFAVTRSRPLGTVAMVPAVSSAAPTTWR
jgi:hypothetical protein